MFDTFFVGRNYLADYSSRSYNHGVNYGDYQLWNSFLRIPTGKKHRQIKLQRLQKVGI